MMSIIDNIRHHSENTAMASLNVAMPDSMKKFVLSRAKQTSHATPTEYIRTLIREDKKRADGVEQLLLEGLDSPIIKGDAKFERNLHRRLSSIIEAKRRGQLRKSA